jgi:hypothetical protein
MIAPIFVQASDSGWDATGATATSPSVSVVLGDIEVALSANEWWTNASDNMTITGGSLIWTPWESLGTTNDCTVQVSTAPVDSDKSMTVVSTKADAGTKMGINTLTVRGSDGIGAAESVQGSGTPSINITTLHDSSAIAVIIADFSAVDGASRVWLAEGEAVQEVTYFRNSLNYTVYIAYYPNVGPLGGKAVGLSAPGGQAYSIAAIEIYGTEEVVDVSQVPFYTQNRSSTPPDVIIG